MITAVRIILLMCVATCFGVAGSTFVQGLPIASVLFCVMGVGALIALWRWTLPSNTRTAITSGVYAVHMLRPQGDRVAVVTITGDPEVYASQEFHLYVLPRAAFVTDLRDFMGKVGVEMEVLCSTQCKIRLRSTLVAVKFRRAGDVPPSA